MIIQCCKVLCVFLNKINRWLLAIRGAIAICVGFENHACPWHPYRFSFTVKTLLAITVAIYHVHVQTKAGLEPGRVCNKLDNRMSITNP